MSEYSPRGEGDDGKSGWIRIGRYDSAKRRALWVRFVELDDSGLKTKCVAIELAAGREGDDAYVRIGHRSDGFNDLLDCMLRAADHIPERYPETERHGAAKETK